MESLDDLSFPPGLLRWTERLPKRRNTMNKSTTCAHMMDITDAWEMLSKF